MNRIQINAKPDETAAKLLDNTKKSLGMVPNLFSTMAHSSAALEFHLVGSGALQKTKLSGALREQIAVSTAGFDGCDYCASAHTALGEMRKVTKEELTLNLAGKASDAKVQAALTFGRKVLETRGHVADKDLGDIRAAGYSEAEIVEIIAVTVDNIFTNYLNSVAQTTIDFPVVKTNYQT
ncbi:MAG: carboxymuconolactone decarboxylase family protein [Burkholderiaceae bacterium]|nr:carboxymuconolactone decarboxylase family protein [Burkholderiaceae bacterium]